MKYWLLLGSKVAVAFALAVAGELIAYADELPAVINDPTRAQQPTVARPPARRDEDKSKGLELPPIPKQETPSPASHGGGTVELNKIVFEGNTAISSANLEEVAAPYLNRKLRASDLEELRKKITLHYINNGYVNSGAVIQPQSVAEGIFKLKIVEGKLVEVKQRGQGRLREAYIRDRLLIGSGDPLNVNKLQDSYRRLLADPLIQRMNGRLLPGTRPGEAVLDIDVLRARPYQLYVGADDYSTPAVGAFTGRIGGWISNALSLGEQIDGQVIITDGGTGYNTGINIPVSPWDTRVTFRYSDIYTTIVEEPVNVLNVKNRVVGFDGGVSQPVYRTFSDDVTLGLNFVVRKSETKISGACVPTTERINDCATQVTVLRMSQHLSHKDERNSVVFWSTFNAGLDALGATTNVKGFPSGEFFSWLGQGMYSYKLLENGAYLALKGNILLAGSPLLPLERFALGGVYTVRGYRENTYVRDNGFNVSLEFHYPLIGGAGAKTNLYLVPFMDYGGAWNNSTPSQLSPPTDYLHSVGIGFNWQYDRLSTEFFWAHSIVSVNDPQQKSLSHSVQDDGIHFRVNLNVF